MTTAKQPYKGAINQPCSACSAGDSKMEYHDHDYVDVKDRRPSNLHPFPPRAGARTAVIGNLDDYERLAHEFCDEYENSSTYGDDLLRRLTLSQFIAWLRKRQETTTNEKSTN